MSGCVEGRFEAGVHNYKRPSQSVAVGYYRQHRNLEETGIYWIYIVVNLLVRLCLHSVMGQRVHKQLMPEPNLAQLSRATARNPAN